MAAPYVPNTAYMYWINSCNLKEVGFGMYATYLAGAYDQAAINDLADAGDDWYSAEMAPLQSVSCVYAGCQVRGVSAAIDLEALDISGATVGGSANAPMPNNVSFVIKHTTGFTGRSARGRSYMVGIPNNNVTSNEDNLTDAAALAYKEAFDALDAILDARGWNAVVVSRYTGNVLRTTPITTTITGHSYTDTKLDTRRKRLG